MRRIRTIFCFAALTALMLLSLSPTETSNAQRNQSSSLDEQALGEANRFFSRMYVKCGEYYYYKYNREMSFMYQCKYPPSFAAIGKPHQPKRLSEADRLNGVDPLPIAWEGYAVINLGLCRQQAYSQKDEPGYSAWGQWSDKNNDALPLTNRKGRWEFYNQPIGGELATKKVIVPLTCKHVPSSTRSVPVKAPYWGGQHYEGQILKIPSSFGNWFSLGRGRMIISLPSSYSTIFIDGTNNTRNPLGQAHYMGAQLTTPQALAPRLMLGAIILKVGENGEPYQPFTSGDIRSLQRGVSIDTNQEVFVAINDSNHSDNRGEHIIIVESLGLRPQTSPISDSASRLYFDGVYKGVDNGRFSYLRFYPDGSVFAGSYDRDMKESPPCLGPGSKNSLVCHNYKVRGGGVYSVSDSKIEYEFPAEGQAIAIRAVGVIEEKSLKLDIFVAETNQIAGRNLVFTFQSLQFPVATISPMLSVPQLISPIDDAVFDLYPRTTRLTWQPVAGAVRYVVEIDWFSNGTGWVCPDQPGNRSVGCQLVRVTSTEYTFDFLGMTQGRWRVSAINASGQESNKSPWRTFKYTR